MLALQIISHEHPSLTGKETRGDLPTKRGNQLAQSAQERMTRRNPSARTKARRMTAE